MHFHLHHLQNHDRLTGGITWGDITQGEEENSVESPDVLTVLKHSYRRFAVKPEGKQVSWGLFFKAPSSEETARILAAGGFMKLCHTSQLYVLKG